MRSPRPRGLPVLGSLLDVRGDPAGVFLRAAPHGAVAHGQAGPRQRYLITIPADVRHVPQETTSPPRGWTALVVLAGRHRLPSHRHDPEAVDPGRVSPDIGRRPRHGLPVCLEPRRA